MAIELANIQLNKVHRVETLEQAALIPHHVPGLEGNLVQALGRNSVRLGIEGIFYGATAISDLEALREIYKQREPVDFLAEIVGQAYFGQVILEQFEVQQRAGEPDQFNYRLTIAEYVEPPQPQAPTLGVPDVDTAILDEAQNFMDSVSGALAAIDLLSVPDFADPTPPLRGALDQVKTSLDGLSSVATGLQDLFGGGE